MLWPYFRTWQFQCFLKRKFNESLETFDEIVYKTREIVRPDRSEPRPKKPKKALFNELQEIITLTKRH